MASKPKHICAALRRHPRLARELGYLIADYAGVELLAFQIFAMLSSLSPTAAYSLWFSRRSINNKTQLLERESWRLSPQLAVALKRTIRRLKGAASRRTEIAHAHMMEGAGGLMRLHLFGDKAAVAPFDEDFIKRTIDQLHSLATDVLTLSTYIGALAPDTLRPKLEAIYAPINEQLQHSLVPQRRQSRFGATAQAASEARLGIDPKQPHGVKLTVPVHSPLSGFPS
jgi:hypothetical protein